MSSINRRHFGMLVVATALLPAGAARAEDVAVHIDNFVFEPAQLTVQVGQTVTWTNRDDIPHTVVCAGKFRSKTMDTDGTFSFTFTAQGDERRCRSEHPTTIPKRRGGFARPRCPIWTTPIRWRVICFATPPMPRT